MRASAVAAVKSSFYAGHSLQATNWLNTFHQIDLRQMFVADRLCKVRGLFRVPYMALETAVASKASYSESQIVNIKN